MCTCAVITVLCLVTIETSCFSCYIKATNASRCCCTVGCIFSNIIRVLCINYISTGYELFTFLLIHATFFTAHIKLN